VATAAALSIFGSLVRDTASIPRKNGAWRTPDRRESCYGHALDQLIAGSDGAAAFAALAGARKVLLQSERACECGV